MEHTWIYIVSGICLLILLLPIFFYQQLVRYLCIRSYNNEFSRLIKIIKSEEFINEESVISIIKELPGMFNGLYKITDSSLFCVKSFYSSRAFIKNKKAISTIVEILENHLPFIVSELIKERLVCCQIEELNRIDKNFIDHSGFKQYYPCYIIQIPIQTKQMHNKRNLLEKHMIYIVGLTVLPIPQTIMNRLSESLCRRKFWLKKVLMQSNEKATTDDLSDKRDRDHYTRLLEKYIKQKRKLKSFKNYLARISHDIRLPLSGIMINFNLIEKEMMKNSKDEKVEITLVLRRIKNQLQILENFTHDLLQLKTGKTQKVEKTDNLVFDDIITSILNGYREVLKNKGIEVSFNARARTQNTIDGSALKRILYNLISNAIKFCSSPGRLYISTKTDYDCLIMELEDSGDGLSSSEETVFKLSRKNIGRCGGGWGIGLAAAMDLATKLNGNLIPITPQFGKGARFLLVLPVDPMNHGSDDKKDIGTIESDLLLLN